MKTITPVQKEIINRFLLERLSPRLIVLFGSAAVGATFRPESDIDLAFLSDRPIDDDGRLPIAAELSAELAREVDLVDLRKAGTLLKFQIARDGKALYQAHPQDFARFQVHAMQEHNDARKFYDLDREYVLEFLRGGVPHAEPGPDPPQADQPGTIP